MKPSHAQPITHALLGSVPSPGFVLLACLMLLSSLSLLALLALRSALLQTQNAGAEGDQLLALAHAEAALRDAELDLAGRRHDGRWCDEVACQPARSADSRPGANLAPARYWRNDNPTLARWGQPDGGRTGALNEQGVYSADAALACGRPVWLAADWQHTSDGQCLDNSSLGPVRLPTTAYGTFTEARWQDPFGALRDWQSPGVVPHPRYLIEVFALADLGPSNSTQVWFRITAMGQGLRVGPLGRTRVFLQTVYAP